MPSPCAGGTKWQQCCPCQRGPQKAGSVLRVKSLIARAATTTWRWCFNHPKVAPCPLPRFALCSLPTFQQDTQPRICSQNSSPSVPGDAPGFALSHGKHHSWGPASTAQTPASPLPPLWAGDSPASPLPPEHSQPLCPASDNSCPLSRAIRLCSVQDREHRIISARLEPAPLQ